jgi:hypothetical protein
MILHKNEEVIIIHSYPDTSIVLNINSGKSEFVRNIDLKTRGGNENDKKC